MAAVFEGVLHSRCGAVTVLGKEEGYKLRMYGLVVAEISAKEAADEVTVNGSVIAWEMNIFK